jgi:hypothetical protein
MKKLPILILALCLAGTLQLTAQSGKKSIDATGFDAIALGISVDVVVMKGDYKVEISGPSEAIENVEISTNGNTLAIGGSKKRKSKGWSSKNVTVMVTMPSIRELSIGGSGNISLKDSFDNQEEVTVNVGGSGDVQLQGSANTVSINISGSGDVKAANMKSAKCEVNIAGSGDVIVGATKELDVSIAGSGDVKYQGEPRINKSIVGSGSVARLKAN